MSGAKRNILTITASEMREINRSSILELIRCNGPISRTKISENLQVSLPTVMRIVDELIIDGLIIEEGRKEWSGGRKRSLLRFNGEQHIILGVDLGGTKIFGAVANLSGEVLYELSYPDHRTHAEESLELVCKVIDQLLEFANGTKLPVRGIGIGVPGIVQPDTGIVNFAPALHWKDFPLKSRLMEHYAYPIAIENDVNLAALGEMSFGSKVDENNLVLLTIGTGIGAGVIINGAIYAGSHYMAGEVGYFLPDRTFLGKQYPGFGALEELISGSGIAGLGREALKGRLSPADLDALTAEHVFASARREEAWAVNILKDVIDYLAQLIAAITLIYDPDVIILGGGVSQSSDLLIEPVLKRLKGAILHSPEVRASRLGYRAAIMGAIIRLLRITTNYYLLQKYT